MKKNDFYEKHVLSYAEKIKNYLRSSDFRDFFKSVNGKYLYENYFDYFVEHTVGGKCIRGYELDLFYRIFGGTDERLALTAAVALELFESAVLMHDDVIDRSELRRGKPSAYVALGGGHTGTSRALCLGDAGLFTSVALLNTDKRLKKISPFLTEIFLQTISGEIADTDLAEKGEICDNDVIEVYLEKTASYTVLAPAVAGAVLAGVKLQKAKRLLTDFATDTGVAFQIKDDLLGIFESAENIGKIGASDIAEGKKSLLVSHFDKNATSEQKSSFYAIYGKGTPSPDEVKTVKDLLVATNARKYAETKANQAFASAKARLNVILNYAETSENLKNEADDFLSFLENRTK